MRLCLIAGFLLSVALEAALRRSATSRPAAMPMRSSILLLALCALPVVSAAQAPAHATVRVLVVDSATGSPVAHAGVQANGWTGLAWTDSTGRFRMTGVPLVTELNVRCPTRRRLAGRVTFRQPLLLPAGADTQVVVRLDAPSCVEPPVRSEHVELAGHYTFGFESSNFRPCGGLPAAAKFYGTDWGSAWVQFADSVRGRDLRWPEIEKTEYYPTVFVRWRGTLTGPGAYGHMGVATYGLVVDEILEVRRPLTTDCR